MRASRRLRIVIMVAAVTAVVFGAAANERALLLVQDWLAIPPQPLRIGLAEFEKPDGWLLIASREDPDRPVRLFGILPRWSAIGPFTVPAGRFYAFRLVGDPDRRTVTLIEEIAPTNDAIAEVMVRASVRRDDFGPSPLKRRTFRGHDALEWRSGSGSIVNVPALRLTIVMEPRSSEAGVGLALAGAR